MRGLDIRKGVYAFAEYRKQGHQKVPINEGVDVLKRSGALSPEFFESATEMAVKNAVRKVQELAGRYTDEDGNSLESFSLIETKEDGTKQQVYLFVMDFTERDFITALTYCRKRGRYWQGKFQRLLKIATQKYGDEFQEKLPFDPYVVVGAD